MLDLDDLKRKAEAAGPGFMEATSVQTGSDWYAKVAMERAHYAFIAAANPQTVLALIAEIERLRVVPFVDWECSICFVRERTGGWEPIPHTGHNGTWKRTDGVDNSAYTHCADGSFMER